MTAWPDVAGRGLFSADLTNLLVSTGVDSGYLTSTMQITASLSMSLTSCNQASLPVRGVAILVDPAGAATRFGLTDAGGNDRRGFDLSASITLCGLNLDQPFFVLDAGSESGFARGAPSAAAPFGRGVQPSDPRPGRGAAMASRDAAS